MWRIWRTKNLNWTTVKYIKFHTPYAYSSKQHKKIAISKTVKSHDVSAANYGVDYILGKKK